MNPTHFLKTPGLCAAVLLASACGTTEGSSSLAAGDNGPSCLRPAQISNWSLINDDTVIVQAGAGRYWQLDLMGPCPQFDWTRWLGFQTSNGVARTSLVCPSQPEQLDVLMPVGSTVHHCPVKALRALSPAEVASLPPNARP